MAPLRLRIVGELGQISLRGFLTALDSTLSVLRDLDSGVSREPSGSLDWVVTNLSVGSLCLEVEPRSRFEDKNVGPEVVAAFVAGLGQIEAEGTTPPYFSDIAMQKTRRLLKLIGRQGMAGLEVTSPERRVEITARASANIDQLIPIRRRSIGSIEGMLEMISIHSKPRFVVYHGRTRKAVTCRFGGEDMLEAAKEALGKRVLVLGVVHSNARGEPMRVDPERIRTFRDPRDLPASAELKGIDPDFTGEMTTEEYLRSVRNG